MSQSKDLDKQITFNEYMIQDLMSKSIDSAFNNQVNLEKINSNKDAINQNLREITKHQRDIGILNTQNNQMEKNLEESLKNNQSILTNINENKKKTIINLNNLVELGRMMNDYKRSNNSKMENLIKKTDDTKRLLNNTNTHFNKFERNILSNQTKIYEELEAIKNNLRNISKMVL
jgi:hypothetical protein